VCLIGGRECSPVAGWVHGDARTSRPTARQRSSKRKNFDRQRHRPRRDVYIQRLWHPYSRAEKDEARFRGDPEEEPRGVYCIRNIAGIAVKLVSLKARKYTKKKCL